MDELQSIITTFLSIKNKSKKDKFIKTLDIMANSRGKLNVFARQYYKAKNCRFIHDEIPLLIDSNVFDYKIRDISEVKLKYTDTRTEIKQKLINLPDNSKSYIENIILNKYSGNEEISPYKDNFCYRLVKINSPTELQFEKCSYFDYINTCEYGFYLFTCNLIKNTDKKDHLKIKKVKRKINYLDLSNRYLVPGINTLLIFLDKDEPIIYIHQRSKKNIAEAINTKHVVPAGTFQPIHIDDGNHVIDFSLYTNILREFGEELAGDKELIHPKGVIENVLERPSLRGIHHLIELGRGKIYYGGVTMDCLTLKPEILTIMVLHRCDYEKLIGKINFAENYEGEPFAISFTKENLIRYSFDKDMLPAGAGCLWLAHQNYNNIKKYMESWRPS